jgi:hypothetical protein
MSWTSEIMKTAAAAVSLFAVGYEYSWALKRHNLMHYSAQNPIGVANPLLRLELHENIAQAFTSR